MYARIAIFEGIDPAEEERTRDEVQSRTAPILQRLEGFQGYLDLMDSSSGRAMFISFFDSEENMRAAEPVFDQEMPQALSDLFEQWSGRRTGVEHYEVAADRRRSI